MMTELGETNDGASIEYFDCYWWSKRSTMVADEKWMLKRGWAGVSHGSALSKDGERRFTRSKQPGVWCGRSRGGRRWWQLSSKPVSLTTAFS